MTNLQPIDLHDVELYWKSRGLVDERHLPYYVRWLQRFFVEQHSAELKSKSHYLTEPLRTQR